LLRVSERDLKMRRVNEKIVLFILAALALGNLIFLIKSSSSGPIVGFAVATGAALHWWIRRNPQFTMIIALVWMGLHIYELVKLGFGSYPVLFLLNLLLPVPLFYCSLKILLFSRKDTNPR